MQNTPRNNKNMKERMYVFDLAADTVQHGVDGIGNPAPYQQMQTRPMQHAHQRFKGDNN